jgi:purine-binding chemotaxis protein CheW
MTARCCSFEVGELLVGIEVDRVREVILQPAVTPVPLAGPGVLGLLSRRGEIVTVLDARTRLGLAAGAGGTGGVVTPAVHVVVGLDGETVSLAVDREGDVVEVDFAARQPVPETVPLALRRLLDGVVELDDGRLMVMLAAERTTEAR